MLVAGPSQSSVAFKPNTKEKDRLNREWKALHKKNPALYSIALHLAGYSRMTLGRSIVLTQIWRTDTEQKEIYGPHTTQHSPHQSWCAVDLRCKDLSDDQRAHLEQALRKYDRFNKFKHLPSSSRTVWIHQVPNGGIHFHIQFWGFDKALPSFFELREPDGTYTA